VIDAMKPAMEELSRKNEQIAYYAADATNYATLRKALGKAERNGLLLTTEGLLMYLTQSELEEVFRNVRRLLLEFGGEWICSDNTLISVQKRIMDAAMKELPAEEKEELSALSEARKKNGPKADNAFFQGEEAKRFVKNMGFDLHIVPASEHMPETFRSLYLFPEETRDAVREAIGTMPFWVMKAQPLETEDVTLEEDAFRLDVRVYGDAMHITAAGRLDTISAPSLLAAYRKAKDPSVRAVCLHLEDLAYISSAGLRALLIMRKECPREEDFAVLGMSEAVKEIFATTAFDEIFC
jgi:anti-anti-sigma factor